jgi:hypothetical protein
MNRVDAGRMIQRRAAELGMRIKIGCHTFPATGITAYLEAGETLEYAPLMAAHENPRTTKLHDRTVAQGCVRYAHPTNDRRPNSRNSTRRDE